jgi:tetratricopeptide (TPR) repeat protein
VYLRRTEEIAPQSPTPMNDDRLGQAYASRIMSKKCDDLERETIVAIDYFKKAIEIQTKLNLETDRANTLVRMGELYRDIGNYKSAIEVTKRALLTFRKVADRLSEASALVAMGDIYQKYHIEEHIERAIEAYYKSLELYTREEFPEEWGRVQNNLAAAFSQRIAGDKAENIERAIEAYYKSLELYTREEFPEQYAEIQNNLAIAYRQRIRGDRAENRKRADEADSNSRSNVL